MWAAGLKKTSCCHLVENSSHSGCAVQTIVICGTSTPKQYIGLTNHYAAENFGAENGLRMAITLLLKGIRTSPFGTLVQGPLSQSSTLVESSVADSPGTPGAPVADYAFVRMDDVSLQLIAAKLDHGT